MNQLSARNDEPQARFPFGHIVATPNALARIPNDEIVKALSRHFSGDWGTLDSEDWKANEHALKQDGRLFSVGPQGQSSFTFHVTGSPTR